MTPKGNFMLPTCRVPCIKPGLRIIPAEKYQLFGKRSICPNSPIDLSNFYDKKYFRVLKKGSILLGSLVDNGRPQVQYPLCNACQKYGITNWHSSNEFMLPTSPQETAQFNFPRFHYMALISRVLSSFGYAEVEPMVLSPKQFDNASKSTLETNFTMEGLQVDQNRAKVHMQVEKGKKWDDKLINSWQRPPDRYFRSLNHGVHIYIL